jgi:hypothetical protein
MGGRAGGARVDDSADGAFGLSEAAQTAREAKTRAGIVGSLIRAADEEAEKGAADEDALKTALASQLTRSAALVYGRQGETLAQFSDSLIDTFV